MYELWRKSKGADQMCSYCTADLRLCFAYADCWFSDAAAQLLAERQKAMKEHINSKCP